MSHYRDLNKELVEQVQTMRRNMKIYCDEIVYLKAELMQQHEAEFNLRKQCYNWALNSIAQLIQYVQPESEILPVLEDHISSERLSCTSAGNRDHRPSRRSNVCRRSSILTREFQRSNSVINLRKSVCGTSPIRSTNNGSSDEEEQQNSPAIPIDAEKVENTEDDYASQSHMPPQITNTENIIVEESEEEAEENLSCVDMDIESFYESVEEVSINITEDRCTLLKDNRNILKSTIAPNKLNNENKCIEKRILPKRAKKINYREKENFESSNNDIRKTPNKTSFAEKAKKDIVEDTIQELRRCSISRHNFDTNIYLPTNQDRASLSSTTLILNDDITIKNFKDAACSTPNSRGNSLETTTSTHCETESTLQTSTKRPSRHCKPKGLAEPRLGSKLRNETETVLFGKGIRRSKSKNKK